MNRILALIGFVAVCALVIGALGTALALVTAHYERPVEPTRARRVGAL